MSRSGYSDDLDPLDLGRWRGQVASAIRGKRGQAFFRELIDALDAMAEKKLIAHYGHTADGVCALGSIDLKRGSNLDELDRLMNRADYDRLGERFGIAHQLAQEVMYENDERWCKTPEERWVQIRKWAESNLKAKAAK